MPEPPFHKFATSLPGTLMTPHAAYDELVARSRQRSLLSGCIELLGWDELTQMPSGGVESRGQQLAYLKGLLHEAWTEPRLGGLLGIVGQSPLVQDVDQPAAVNIRHWRREHDRLTRLPRRLIEELAHVTTLAQQHWAQARRANDYGLFQPWLARIVRLKRDEAKCVGDGDNPYDALLHEFEPDATTTDLEVLFAALRTHLGPMVASLHEQPNRGGSTNLRQEFPVTAQRALLETVATQLGYDFQRGRLDTTTHPFFSAVGQGDCRITTRFNPCDFREALFAMLHEMGHALYEQGLDPSHAGTPFGESLPLSLHESQARLWEVFLGTSRPFWQYFFPQTQRLFPETLASVQLGEFHAAVNRLQPGANRVRADAVRYDLHIMIRFELETALVAGDLHVEDVPSAWNDKYREYLHVEVVSDAEGCLQDSHWSAGSLGYFPFYTVGNIYAAQIFATIHREIPELEQLMARGEYQPLLAWLRENIYRHGQQFTAADLLRRVTGHACDHQPLVSFLSAKCENA